MRQSHCGVLGLSNPAHKLHYQFTGSKAEAFHLATAHEADAASARGTGLDRTLSRLLCAFPVLHYFMNA